MAPEQLEGKDADARTDIFAFGAVLYEMATGKKAFSGTSQASLISAIMKEEPGADLRRPAGVARRARSDRSDVSRQGPRGALAERRRRRPRAGLDRRDGLADRRRRSPRALAGAPGSRGRSPPRPFSRGCTSPRSAARRPRQRRSGWSSPSSCPSAPSRTISSRFRRTEARSPSPESPRGKFLLRIRELSSSDVRSLPGTESAESIFWSPDGRSLGFVSRGKLRRIDVATGSIEALADAEAGRGGTWSPGGDILFAQKAAGAIFRVAATGGAVAAATTLEKGDLMHRWPQFLPDGKRFLFFVKTSSPETTGTYLASLGKAGRKLVLRNGATGVFVAPATLLYCRSTALLAQHFDPDTGELSGAPETVVRPVMRAELGSFLDLFTVSQTGVLVYRAGNADRQLTWTDRRGNVRERWGRSASSGPRRFRRTSAKWPTPRERPKRASTRARSSTP